jgi:hypothetical protein
MSINRNFPDSSLDQPDVPETPSTERVEQTEVGGFEKSGLLSSEGVADYIKETVPPEHLENCPSIQYDPDHPVFEESENTLAFYTPKTGEIRVGPSDRLADTNELLDTITHEIGHNVHQNIIDQQPGVADSWNKLYSKSDTNDFVSSYARTNVYEDFAETYMTYVRDPELLQFVNTTKYEFMRNNVFGGREYPLKIE